MGEGEPASIGPYSIIRPLDDTALRRTYLGKRQGRAKDYITVHVYHLPLATSELQEAFMMRGKALKKLKHRQIAEIIDYGLLPGDEQASGEATGYLVMQFLPGKTLQEQFPGERYRAEEIKRILSPLADALQYAHSAHIAHGSLHPGSLLFDDAGQVHLTGFAPLPPHMLPTEAIEPAALPYMAPEQLAGQPEPASDQYALAVMVYEWLCGQRPYSATEHDTLAQAQRDAAPATPRSLRDDLSPTVEAVLLKALSLRPQDRFPHVQAFAYEYLRALMGFPMQGGTPPALPVTRVLTPPAPRPDSLSQEERVPRLETRQDDLDTPFLPPLITGNEVAGKDDTADLDYSEQNNTAADDEYDEYDKQGERPKPRQFSSKINPNLLADVTSDLSQGGVLSQRLDGYEERPAQLEMALDVSQALLDKQHALLEASTGTGKSLAYLLPIVRSGQGAIISTANKALQEQLYFKDIPFVQKNVQKFGAALVKGVANYICLKRLNEEYEDAPGRPKNPEISRLWNYVHEFELTINGDFETLGFTVPPEVRSRVNDDSDQCAWAKCPFFKDCYVRAMKERAQHAQVVVVNHTLLLLDAASSGHILPQRDITVIDEAHHLEEEATRAFTVSVNQSQVHALLSLNRLRAHTSAELQKEADEQAKHAWQVLEAVANPGFKGRTNLREPFEEGLKLASLIDELARDLEKQRPLQMLEDEEVLYDKLITRTRTLASNIRHVFSLKHPEKYVYYVSLVEQRGKRRVSPLEVSAAPLDVTVWLRERLFDQSHVIATSATLTTVSIGSISSTARSNPIDIDQDTNGPTFTYFRQRVGLDPQSYSDVRERILPLTFDYEHNALLYLPRHLPMPAYGDTSESFGYMKALADEMMRLVEASRGRAFLLFSSKRMMDAVWNEFMTRLPSHLDMRLLRQGEMTRIELVKIFREAEGAVLFGLKSFWEGVDIAGEALSLVVIDKLPFDPPDEPVHEARIARIKANNEDWFGTYVLPQAVLRLKQGLGRLLRTHEDRGVMAILDTRLHRKGYGKLVISALPPARRVYDFREVERFFEEDDDGDDDDDAPF